MKGPTKRKMYQKRRKKEKAELRKRDAQFMPPGKIATAFFKCKNRTQKGPNPTHSQNQFSAFSPTTSYSQGLQLWWQTYCSAIEFHSRQQNDLQLNNQENYLTLLQKYANEYETSSEEEEDTEAYECPNIYEINKNQEEEYVDEDYIKFLEITHKHREELRLKRAEDNC